MANIPSLAGIPTVAGFSAIDSTDASVLWLLTSLLLVECLLFLEFLLLLKVSLSLCYFWRISLPRRNTATTGTADRAGITAEAMVEEAAAAAAERTRTDEKCE